MRKDKTITGFTLDIPEGMTLEEYMKTHDKVKIKDLEYQE